MRVVLYSHHSLFEPALSMAAALAESAEVHLLLEVPAGRWQAANFDAAGDVLATGLVAADPVLAPAFPEQTRHLWRAMASFHLVVTGEQRARHPASVRLMCGVLDWIRQLDPDVLHIDDVDVSQRLVLALAIVRPPCPVLVGCHDPDPHSGERDWRVKHLTRRLMFARADAYLVHHEAGLEALRRRHPRLHGCVYSLRLASYAFLHHGRPSTHPGGTHEPFVLMFGRITPYKGLDNLFRAAPLVAQEVPDVRFVVAGRPEGSFQPPKAPALDNGGRVETMYDYMSNDQTAALFGQAQVAVCPYADASQSGVVLTAYAFGCPVVVTDVGGLPEYVTNGVTGLVVPAGDHQALADALIRCFTEPQLLATLRAGVATATATDLNWQRTAAELSEIYAALALTARRRRRQRRWPRRQWPRSRTARVNAGANRNERRRRLL